MLGLLSFWIQNIQTVLTPLYFLLSWTIVILVMGTIWGFLHDMTMRARQMHQIPCCHCQFFTNDYRLKCPVQPVIANTEQAINCSDYRSLS